jgi:transposase
MLAFFRVQLAQKCTWTQNQLGSGFKEAFGFTISRQLVSNILKRLGYSRKRIKRRGFRHNRSVTLMQQFHDTMLPLLESNDRTIVSVDETGFDHRDLPSYGYAQLGHPAVEHSRARQHKRVSVIYGVDNTGRRFYEVVDDTVVTSMFANFIRSMPWEPGAIIIMDNASIHKGQSVRNACSERGFKIVYCPPYSPDMNPIENVFAFIKSHYRRSYESPNMRQRIVAAFEAVAPALPTRCFEHFKGLLRQMT